MGILAQIVAADDGELEAVAAATRPLDAWSGIERRGIDTAKIAMLHGLLTGEDLDLALARLEPVAVADEGAVVLRLADELMERLAALDEEALELVAEELAATEEFEAEGWDPDDVQALVMDLADLARLAEAQGQAMFVWMHPLLT